MRMGKIERSVGSCIEAWMLFMGSAWRGFPPKFLYYESPSLDNKYGFVNKLSSYIQILKENVIVTVLLE